MAADPAARAARLPTTAWKVARDGLATGAPVLVQVPRRGYAPRLACAECRTPARCAVCAGPLAGVGRDASAACAWCGAAATNWRCARCGARGLRATVVGARRTAEELGRVFPGVNVRTSGGDQVLATVLAEPALVVATPGAEPVAANGYAAAILLDGWMLLSRPDLRAAEEALRRWLTAAALVRPAVDGGRVVVSAAAELPVVQALIRGRPRAFAVSELAERRQLHLPPAARLASITGPAAAVAELLALTALPAGAEVLGPVEVRAREPAGAPAERVLVKAPLRSGSQLAAALKAAAAVRSARKSGGPVQVEIDPIVIG